MENAGVTIAMLQLHVVSAEPAWRDGLVGALRERALRARAQDRLSGGFLSDSFNNLLILDLDVLGPCAADHAAGVADARLREVERMLADEPHLAVVLAAGRASAEQVVDGLRAGAVDFVDRQRPLPWLAARIAATASTLSAMPRRSHCLSDIGRLSPREREVLDQLARGHRTKQIAHALHLSPRTVEMHCARLRRRLGVQSMGQAIGLWMQAKAARAA